MLLDGNVLATYCKLTSSRGTVFGCNALAQHECVIGFSPQCEVDMNPLEEKCRCQQYQTKSQEYKLLPDMNIIKTSDAPITIYHDRFQLLLAN